MSSGLRRRRVGLTMTGLLLAGLVAHSVLYFTATARIEAEIPAFLASAAAQGWRVETGPPTRSGWPWAPTIRLSHAVVVNGPTSLVWTAEQIDLVTPFNDLTALHIIAAGAQTLELQPGPAVQLRAADAQLRIPFSPGTPATISIHNLIAQAPPTEIRIGDIRGQILPPASGSASIEMTSSGIQLAPALPPPFAGPMTASMQLAARQPACPPSPNPALQITASEMAWGPLHATATGTAGLDKDCQPSGRATLRVKGAPDMLDALAKNGLIASGPAAAARAVLGLLAIAAHGQPITLPVSLENRTLTVAQFPLLRFPAIK